MIWQILSAIGVSFLAAFLFSWSQNLNFSAHLQEDTKKLFKFHAYSVIVLTIAILIVIGYLIGSS